jgi:hypothetical protein
VQDLDTTTTELCAKTRASAPAAPRADQPIRALCPTARASSLLMDPLPSSKGPVKRPSPCLVVGQMADRDVLAQVPPSESRFRSWGQRDAGSGQPCRRCFSAVTDINGLSVSRCKHWGVGDRGSLGGRCSCTSCRQCVRPLASLSKTRLTLVLYY